MDYYEEFMTHFTGEDKENSVKYIMGLVSQGKLDIVTLYNEILRPALYDVANHQKKQTITVAQEHMRTAIVRTIIECCYPYVIKERDHKYESLREEKVLIFCPAEEYHEVGPRMVEDFFTLNGYHAFFMGGNTPRDDLLLLLEEWKPKYLAMSVSNYYNLLAAERTIKDIQNSLSYSPTIILGGYALQGETDAKNKINADLYLQSYDDIVRLGRGEFDEISS